MTRGDGDRADAPKIRSPEPAVVEAVQLLGGAREIVILHRGERYRLRVTQSNKLILTK